jgi:hypothetical protein
MLCGGAIAALVAFGSVTTATAQSTECSSRPGTLWNLISRNPYQELPRYSVDLAGFDLRERGLLQDSVRTLNFCSDVIPPKPKRVHANGICMLGRWTITEPSPFTGYFRQGSTGAVIMRASVANGWTRRGEYRFFAMAGKIFPTTDPNETARSANWFTLASPANGFANRFLDVDLTNDVFYVPLPILRIPGFRALVTAFQTATVVPNVITSFVRADRAFANPTRILARQLYPVAELGESDRSSARSPQWMRIDAPRSVRRVNAIDFRDELRVQNYPQGLQFRVSVADVGLRIGAKLWRQIGVIDVSETVTSLACDQILHFPHPQWRTSLGRVGALVRANELVDAAEEWSGSSLQLLDAEEGVDQALDQTLASIDALQDALGKIQSGRRRGEISDATATAAATAITAAVESLTKALDALDNGDGAAARAWIASANDDLTGAASAISH